MFEILNRDNADARQHFFIVGDRKGCYIAFYPCSSMFFYQREDSYSLVVNFTKFWRKNSGQYPELGYCKLYINFLDDGVEILTDGRRFNRKPKFYQKLIENNLDDILETIYATLYNAVNGNYETSDEHAEALKFIEGYFYGSDTSA